MIAHLVSLLLCLDFLRVLCEQAPVILFISPDQQKVIGDTVEFTCQANYNPAYAVFWMKDSTILSNNSVVNVKDSRLQVKHSLHNNSYTLSLENVQELDKGEYVCVLVFDKLRMTRITKLDVLAEEVPSSFRPKFLSKPVNLTVKAGATIILPCDVDKLGDDYVLLWKKDTSVLTAARLRISHNSRLELLDNWYLKVASITPEDEGTYICQVSTKLPMELKHFVQLEAPPLASIVTHNSEVVGEMVVKSQGEELMLICQASGNPRPNILWWKTNGKLPNGERNSSNPVLHVKSLHIEDSGYYICLAYNKVGDGSQAAFTLQIQYAPKVKVPNPTIITFVGHRLQLFCESEGFPPPTITWYINGVKIENTPKHPMSEELPGNDKQTNILNVTVDSQDDFGNYTCSGTNDFGIDKADIELTGMPAPVIINKGKTSSRTSNYHIDWKVRSYSPILRYKLRLRKVDPLTHQLGEWNEQYIVAENRDGPDQLQTFDISELEPETSYEVVMNAENKYGWNPDSNILKFTTAQKDLINVLPPSSDLDVTEMQPEHSQQPGSSMSKPSQGHQSNAIHLLTILMLVTLFWL